MLTGSTPVYDVYNARALVWIIYLLLEVHVGSDFFMF